ncbi:MAG: septal ring lytic transglycosylase RlpA family protein [Candidatus Comchoanobacterales bacterium]
MARLLLLLTLLIPSTSIMGSWLQPEPLSKYGNNEIYSVHNKTYHVLKDIHSFQQYGKASWYGEPFHGRKTSTMETFDMNLLTAAHKELPIPCYVRVTRVDNNHSVVVRVNDRGPFHPGRVIDLSRAAAQKLGFIEQGTTDVRIDLLVAPKVH